MELELTRKPGTSRRRSRLSQTTKGARRRPGVPVGERPGKGLGPRAAAAENASIDELDLGPKEKRERGPAAENEPETRLPRGGHGRMIHAVGELG